MYRVCALQVNVEGRSFILLFVRYLSRIPEFVVGGGEEVNRKWLYWRLKHLKPAGQRPSRTGVGDPWHSQ